MLLVASYVFYAWWDVRFLILLLLTSMIDYSAALGIYGVRLSRRELARLSALLIGGAYLTWGSIGQRVQHGNDADHAGRVFSPWLGARGCGPSPLSRLLRPSVP